MQQNLHFTEINFSEAIKRGESFFEVVNGQHVLSNLRVERTPMKEGAYDTYQVSFVLDGEIGVVFEASDELYSSHLSAPIFFEVDDMEVVDSQKVSVTASRENLGYGGEDFLLIEDMEGNELVYIRCEWGEYSDETTIKVLSPKMKRVKTFSYNLWG